MQGAIVHEILVGGTDHAQVILLATFFLLQEEFAVRAEAFQDVGLLVLGEMIGGSDGVEDLEGGFEAEDCSLDEEGVVDDNAEGLGVGLE
jgi:hypothetical protein